MKTSELTGAPLDWAVAKCEGLEVYFEDGMICLVGQPFDTDWKYWNPTTDWAQGGPIIEREGIGATVVSACPGNEKWLGANFKGMSVEYGPTCLVACMRTYVASKMGDEIEIPEGVK